MGWVTEPTAELFLGSPFRAPKALPGLWVAMGRQDFSSRHRLPCQLLSFAPIRTTASRWWGGRGQDRAGGGGEHLSAPHVISVTHPQRCESRTPRGGEGLLRVSPSFRSLLHPFLGAWGSHPNLGDQGRHWGHPLLQSGLVPLLPPTFTPTSMRRGLERTIWEPNLGTEDTTPGIWDLEDMAACQAGHRGGSG